ncbi:glycosyltransferase family 22 protein, partial [Aureobasidium melanogenum]
MSSPPPPSRPARRQFMTTMTAKKAAKQQSNKALPVTPSAPAEARPTHMFPADLRKPLDAIADPVYLNPLIAFYILAAAHALAAVYFPIQDCDEVYNYYEPTHYLTDGYGKQTWEYSPEYAIRSWGYVSLHAIVIGLRRIIPVWGLPKVWKFYFLRIMLGAICAGSEARLYSKISRTLNPRLGMLFFLIMLTSPGMFHASVSFLPSSFSMYTTALGMAAFIDWRGGMRTAQGMMCMIGGAFLGWPFAAALVAPFMIEEFMLAYFTDKQEFIDFLYRILDGTARSVIVLVMQFCFDGFFYRRVAVVPYNIVWYNVIAAREGKGPDIYGTEPWHFYARNLLLNFNIWFIIALAAMPLYFVHTFVLRQPIFKQSYLRGVFFLTPFYLWLAIFTLQPHKEERFMYPIYPALGFNAALGAHILLTWLGTSNPRSLIAMIPAKLRLFFAALCFIAAVDFGLWRTVGMITAYNAPLSVYAPLREPGVSQPGDNVCLGKEWYRFPSSYHLPTGVSAKFVKSEFRGLLPGDFSQADSGFGLYPGAWLIPSGMNDENIEDPSKYTELSHCSFMVDASFPGTEPSALEPDYINQTETWEKLSCKPFLDASRTGTIGRIGWIPDWDFIPTKYRRQWGEYCLLGRRKSSS